MQYAIHHITRFDYDRPVRESILEVRMCPRTDEHQHCYSFNLQVTPNAQVSSYQDFLGNTIHNFNIPGRHEALRLESHALVEVVPAVTLPDRVLPEVWAELDHLFELGDHLEMTAPSRFTTPTPALVSFAEELDIRRTDDPLTVLRRLNALIYEKFEYSSLSTHVHSPIDDALQSRSGVCQDFAHIFIALARRLRIPCRYVSGYLFHRSEGSNGHDRSAEDGSHAWAEAFLPGTGWVGFDPTNDIPAGDRHIRVALGRDYADVPPTKGVHRGVAQSTLHVGVHVEKARFPVQNPIMPEMALVVQHQEAIAPPDPESTPSDQ